MSNKRVIGKAEQKLILAKICDHHPLEKIAREHRCRVQQLHKLFEHHLCMEMDIDPKQIAV